MIAALSRIKGATRLAFRQFGSLDAVAEILGRGHAQVGRYQDVNSPDVITADQIAVLESQDGVSPHITRTLAALNGHILVAMPKVRPEGKWAKSLADIAKETGEVLARLGNALADDGTVSVREARELLPEIEQALSALSSARSALEEQLQPNLLDETRGGDRRR